MSERFNFLISDKTRTKLREASESVGVTESELVRRILDYALQSRVLNEVVPSMSGSAYFPKVK